MPNQQQQLSSTTAPGTFFGSRAELAEHYKSDWHKYNLKRREAGLVLLEKADFNARLEAAKAMREERAGREERSGKDHLKRGSTGGKKRKDKKDEVGGSKLSGGATTVLQASAYDKMKNKVEGDDENMEEAPVTEEAEMEEEEEEEEPPVIEPRQCLFDKHMSPTLAANVERMHRKYGFFVPDQEYLTDLEGLLGYCHEKIKLGHVCLYCQSIFTTWHGCQKHMISKRHTKLRYERGVDLEEFDPFFDFSEADQEFMGATASVTDEKDGVIAEDGEEDEEWEDVTDDEAEEDDDNMDEDDDEDDENMYAGYKSEIKRFGFDVTPLGELVFPDGRIVGHRGLARYYKQRTAQPASADRESVRAARRAAGERLYKGRVYETNEDEEDEHVSTLALARAGLPAGSRAGRSGNGILVSSGGGGYTALSLYRYRAVMKKARTEEKQGQRLKYKTTCNMNRMDKKANNILNGVSVAHAKR